MARIVTKPQSDTVSENAGYISNNKEFWNKFITDIIAGKYALLVGSEILLQEQYSGGDSTKSILANVIEDLKNDGRIGTNYECESFTELSRFTGRDSRNIRKLIERSLLGDSCTYQCSSDDVSIELKELLRTKFFRIVMTTTFDTYLENVLKEIWGDKLRIKNIYEDFPKNDFDIVEQSADEFDIRPTLFYMCGRVNEVSKEYAVTDNDAIKVVAKWLGKDAPSNFLNHLKDKGIISIGCKFEDWLFRFFWHALRQNGWEKGETNERKLKDAVAVSFVTESDNKLNEYLRSKNTYTEPDARKFIQTILDSKKTGIKNIAKANSQLGGIFISYAHDDMPVVAGIAKKINEYGIRVWFDAEKLGSGDQYDERITNAINQCGVFVPILSPQVMQDMLNGNTNRYYFSEWRLAKQRENISKDNIKIMPLAINGYDETSEEHKRNFMFSDKTVLNLMNQPLSTFINNMILSLNK